MYSYTEICVTRVYLRGSAAGRGAGATLRAPHPEGSFESEGSEIIIIIIINDNNNKKNNSNII